MLCKVLKASLSFLNVEMAMTSFFAEVGSQHLGGGGKHGGDETMASLKQRGVRKFITMSLSMPLPLQTYFTSLLPQSFPYRHQHHTFILDLVLFNPVSDMTLIEQFAFPPHVTLDFSACS